MLKDKDQAAEVEQLLEHSASEVKGSNPQQSSST
jgi:hypothetical protein